MAPLDSARTLAFLSAVAQAALPIPLFLLFRGLGVRRRLAAAATALTLLDPVVWMNGVRPMSDSVGMLLAVSAQALLLAAVSGDRGLTAPSFLTGLAAGARVQTAALTLPLWAYAMRRRAASARLAAAAALVAAVVLWAVPTVTESGGVAAYWKAFSGTAGDAAAVEPLVLTWTAHHALRVAGHVVFRPWGAEWLGIAMAVLGGIGAIAAWRRGVAMRLAVLAFAPYVVAHTLFQQAHTQRYAMPYVPLLALLAVLGMEAIARAAGPRRADAALLALAVTGAGACAAVAVPGLSAYASVDSPVYAALRAVTRFDAARPGSVLAGHHMYRRFLAAAPAGMAVLPLPPRREMAALEESWLAGDERPVLFLAEPRRTDLETIDPRARALRGQWSWPRAAALLLSGERPSALDLVEIQPPRWFAGTGWGLSLEMGPFDRGPLRRAYLRASGEPALVMIAGEPTDPHAAEWDGELALDGVRIDRRACGAPWLAAYAIPPANGRAYRPLDFATTRGGVPRAAPFALRGLAYGSASDAMLVRGDGWHFAETSEDGRPFRWATRVARSLINVPPSGARVVAEGDVPRRAGAPAQISLEAGGLRRSLSASGHFRIELDVPAGLPREAILSSDRDFVPDDTQHNGDRRRLALRIESFEIRAR